MYLVFVSVPDTELLNSYNFLNDKNRGVFCYSFPGLFYYFTEGGGEGGAFWKAPR